MSYIYRINVEEADDLFAEGFHRNGRYYRYCRALGSDFLCDMALNRLACRERICCACLCPEDAKSKCDPSDRSMLHPAVYWEKKMQGGPMPMPLRRLPWPGKHLFGHNGQFVHPIPSRKPALSRLPRIGEGSRLVEISEGALGKVDGGNGSVEENNGDCPTREAIEGSSRKRSDKSAAEDMEQDSTRKTSTETQSPVNAGARSQDTGATVKSPNDCIAKFVRTSDFNHLVEEAVRRVCLS